MNYTSGWKYRTEVNVEQLVPMKIEERRGNQWVSLQSIVGSFANQSLLTIRNQYAWDGASFILFRWFGTPVRWLTPSLIHDALYQLMREEHLPLSMRKQVDGVFYHLLRDRGVAWWEAQLAYWAVRIGGNYCIRKRGPQTKEAP